MGHYNAQSMAQALLISTLLTIAGLIVTIVMGFQATPVRAADHIIVAIVTVVGLLTVVLFYLLGPPQRLHSL